MPVRGRVKGQQRAITGEVAGSDPLSFPDTVQIMTTRREWDERCN